MSSPSILVSGGAGYIGSHICCALRERGYIPVTLDNLSRGHKEAVQFGPLYVGDIDDAALLERICAEHKPVAAMHFAAFIEVGESALKPKIYMENNWLKARRFFELLEACDIKQIVFSSTAAVYGTQTEAKPLTETHPLKPINPYGESKLKAESFLREMLGMRSVALRYFNAAGAEANASIGEAHWPETHLIPNAILATLGLKPDPMIVFGRDYPTPDGTAIRDYIHITDLADAHIAALEYLLSKAPSATINLGSGKGASVQEVLNAMADIAGKKVPFKDGPRREGDPAFLVADNQKAFEVLNWKPKLDLNAIISSAYKWHMSPLYKALISQPRSE